MSVTEIKPGSATAFAPATIGNLAVGFDILGACIGPKGDKVKVESRKDDRIVIEEVKGVAPAPLNAERNTSGAALLEMKERLHLKQGFTVKITKGIPLSSGLGGSAASAVGAVVAANHLLSRPCSQEELLDFAAAGENAASSNVHFDNIAPCLLGGICLINTPGGPRALQLPYPDSLRFVMIHQALEIKTEEARSRLRTEVPLGLHIRQAQHLANFVASCYRQDLKLMSDHVKDLIIEEQRSDLIPDFHSYKQEAQKNPGLIGFSISGAGPSMFALMNSETHALEMAESLKKNLAPNKADIWITPVNHTGAFVIEGDGS